MLSGRARVAPGESFTIRVDHRVPGLERVPFNELLEGLGEDLFGLSTRPEGSLIIYNPSRIARQGSVAMIQRLTPGDSMAAAALTRRLRDVVESSDRRAPGV